MIHIKIRGHPPWYARGTPVVKLRDGPVQKTRGNPITNWRDGPIIKIRGKPPFANCETVDLKGNTTDKIRHWQALNDVLISRQKQLVRPVICPNDR